MHGKYVDQEEMAPHADDLRDGVQARLRGDLGFDAPAPLPRARGIFLFRTRRMWLTSSSPIPSLDDLVKMAKSDRLNFSSDPALVRPELAGQLENSF